MRRYIQQDLRSFDKTERDKIMYSWPGLPTMGGVKAMVSELLKPTGGPQRSKTFVFLEHSEVPRQDIVSYLIQSAEASRADPNLFRRHFYLFGKYPEDDRILRFIALSLEDKTNLEAGREPAPHEEPSDEAPWRTCDSAHGILIQISTKRGEIGRSDPAVGDPGGEASYANRDRNISALKIFLAKRGYLPATAVSATEPPQVATPAIPPVPVQPSQPASAEPTPPAPRAQPVAPEPHLKSVASAPRKWINQCIAAVAAVGLTAAFFLIWGRRSSHQRQTGSRR